MQQRRTQRQVHEANGSASSLTAGLPIFGIGVGLLRNLPRTSVSAKRRHSQVLVVKQGSENLLATLFHVVPWSSFYSDILFYYRAEHDDPFPLTTRGCPLASLFDTVSRYSILRP
jgi:hypothetical protein